MGCPWAVGGGICFQMVMGRASGKAPAEVTWFWSCWDSAVGSCHCMSLLHFATRPLREGSRFAHSVSENHSVMSDSFAIPWTVAHQAPLSMGFPRQEYWSSLPFFSSEDLPDPGIKPASPALAGGFFTTKPPAKPL